jgi:hypothetical protein
MNENNIIRLVKRIDRDANIELQRQLDVFDEGRRGARMDWRPAFDFALCLAVGAAIALTVMLFLALALGSSKANAAISDEMASYTTEERWQLNAIIEGGER